MRQSQGFYREGKLTEAVGSLQAYLRDHPSEKKARSFLFELLCFTGEFDRAGKQLAIVAEDSKESKLGIAFYFAALAAEVDRQAYYEEAALPRIADGPADEVTGTFNGKPFSGIRDLDSRLGASLEFLAAGKYHRVAFKNLTRLDISEPKHVRDLCWVPANLTMTEAMGSSELESTLIPVLYPQTHLFDDDRTRLGRATEWARTDTGTEIPCGQRVLVIGGEEVPLLEVRSIEFHPLPGPGKMPDG